MTVTIRYLASLRTRIGRAEDRIEVAPGTTVAELWDRLCPDQPMPANTLVAVNLEYSDLDREVRAGDEVAFFPPVTGG